MGVLLIILQIIGALPGVINFLRILWESIQQIKGKTEKAEAKKKFRSLILRRQNIKKMSAVENNQLWAEAYGLYHEVQDVLTKEGVRA